jgi:hypothetical protein
MNIIPTPDVLCVECEWHAVFECKPCEMKVCGRHRGKHYKHNITRPEPGDKKA